MLQHGAGLCMTGEPHVNVMPCVWFHGKNDAINTMHISYTWSLLLYRLYMLLHVAGICPYGVSVE